MSRELELYWSLLVFPHDQQSHSLCLNPATLFFGTAVPTVLPFRVHPPFRTGLPLVGSHEVEDGEDGEYMSEHATTSLVLAKQR